MLKEIIEIKDFDFSNYIELQKYTKFLGAKNLKNILNILSEFDSSLYTNPRKTLKLIDLVPYGAGASKYIHGIYHVEKVFLYCYLMVRLYNLDKDKPNLPEEFEIILYYAALYHDIGRVDNGENSEHGLNAAKIFYKIFSNHPFFKEDKRRMFLAECLMAIHSENYDYSEKDADKLIQSVLYEHFENNWEETEFMKEYAGEYFKILCDILKDADALDRKRFGDWERAALDEDYLRTDYSKALVQFASEINNLYYSMMKNSFVEPNLKEFKQGDCFHSIGFDFFKIKSILSNGILSQDELKKKNIKVPRNFPGGNFDRWVSVVDASFYPEYTKQEEDKKSTQKTGDEKDYAAGMFTHHGITFYCKDVYLRKAEENKDKALEQGYPWNKSGYVDEKYAYSKILPDNIIGVFIPIECINDDVKKLWYIYESTNMDIIRSRVDYYLAYTDVEYSDSRLKDLNVLLDKYEDLVIKELKRSSGNENSKEYLDASHSLMTQINNIIGQFVFEYYRIKLNTQIFGIVEIVEYELNQILDIEYTAVNKTALDTKELLFLINKTSQKAKIK